VEALISLFALGLAVVVLALPIVALVRASQALREVSELRGRLEALGRRSVPYFPRPVYARRMRWMTFVVERPGVRRTVRTEPPFAVTASAPTISAFFQSAPFTRTSGRSRRIIR